MSLKGQSKVIRGSSGNGRITVRKESAGGGEVKEGPRIYPDELGKPFGQAEGIAGGRSSLLRAVIFPKQ